MVSPDGLPECLAVTALARSDDGLADEIMGIRHARFDVAGVQFHPEAILTRHGHRLLANFLATSAMDRADAAVRASGEALPVC